MSCRTCKDLGWIEVAKDDLRPCLACNNVVGPTKAEVVALAVGFIGLFIICLLYTSDAADE